MCAVRARFHFKWTPLETISQRFLKRLFTGQNRAKPHTNSYGNSINRLIKKSLICFGLATHLPKFDNCFFGNLHARSKSLSFRWNRTVNLSHLSEFHSMFLVIVSEIHSNLTDSPFTLFGYDENWMILIVRVASVLTAFTHTNTRSVVNQMRLKHVLVRSTFRPYFTRAC